MKTNKSTPPNLLSAQVKPLVADGNSCPFRIVGIGASAGGLEAFEQFFRHTAPDCGMAFVLVPHLDPSHASLLAEILQRTTTMPVVEALDQMPVAANCVYVIPPNRDMAIFNGSLQLNLPEQPRGQRMPIDAFLRSLAEDCQENAVGIILSGTGTDGTLGCRAIIGAGGITLAQEPTTAKYDGMPSSVIQSGFATFVQAVEQLPEILLNHCRSHSLRPESVPTPAVASAINRVLLKLRNQTGHDFTQYKKSTITRRIVRRMLQHNIEDVDNYARYLKDNPAEVQALFKELLINVTNFFRDHGAFAALQNDILPQLCQGKPDDYVFRAWVAGCATGEEAYSIAILLHELREHSHPNLKVLIYATDLTEDVIAIARAGLYSPNISQDVNPARLRRYFNKENEGYRIKKEIRELVVFAVQNAIKDPPFTKLDLLSCRNLMIYLEAELQDRLLTTFHYALKPEGVLFLSPSEGVGTQSDLFAALNRKWKLFRANHAKDSSGILIPHNLSFPLVKASHPAKVNPPKHSTSRLVELTRHTLVQYFAPASVVTDRKGDILYVHGETGKYLRPAPGQASLNVIEMAREGLELELRAAINFAANGGLPTLNRELQVKTNGGFTAVSLSVRPLPNGNDDQQLLLVSFQDIARPAVKPKRQRTAQPAEHGQLGRLEALERDLMYLKENHQIAVQELQAANEEAKSTNEEMQATNEELQSANEELETSKEELQSINEELVTVNSELQAKCEQLANMQNDIKNLLDNIKVGIIFLDRQLMIRSFTREAIQVYRLVPSDVGRPLNDIKSVLADKDLLNAAQTVLETLIPYECELNHKDDAWILARIQPYRTVDNLIDGVVLTFTDISSRIRAIASGQALALAEGIIDSIREPLLVLDSTLTVVSASRSFYRDFQVTPEQTVGRQIYGLGNGQWDIPALRKRLESILPSDGSFENYEVVHVFPSIGHRKMLLNARRIVTKAGEAQMILLSIEINS